MEMEIDIYLHMYPSALTVKACPYRLHVMIEISAVAKQSFYLGMMLFSGRWLFVPLNF